MISFLVKKHIYSRAKDWNLKVPSNWEDISELLGYLFPSSSQ